MIRTLHERLLADGDMVPITKLCAWFGVPRRTVYYKPTKSPPKLDDKFVQPIKALITQVRQLAAHFGDYGLVGFNEFNGLQVDIGQNLGRSVVARH